MTEEQKKAYLKAPHLCPYCQSADIDAGDRTHNGEWIDMEVQCQSCKRMWRDIYTLTDVEEIE